MSVGPGLPECCHGRCAPAGHNLALAGNVVLAICNMALGDRELSFEHPVHGPQKPGAVWQVSSRMIIAGLDLCGRDISRATHLLRLFEELQAMYVADRDLAPQGMGL